MQIDLVRGRRNPFGRVRRGCAEGAGGGGAVLFALGDGPESQKVRGDRVGSRRDHPDATKVEADRERAQCQERDRVSRDAHDEAADVGEPHQVQEKGSQEVGVEDVQRGEEEGPSTDRSGGGPEKRGRAGVRELWRRAVGELERKALRAGVDGASADGEENAGHEPVVTNVLGKRGVRHGRLGGRGVAALGGADEKCAAE